MSKIKNIIAVLLSLLFLYSAYHKLVDLNAFKISLIRSRMIKNQYPVILLSYFIPVFELLLGLCLIFFEKHLKKLFFICFFTMLVFTIYYVSLYLIAKDAFCACGGFFTSLTFIEHLVVNLFFIAISLLGIYTCKQNR